jgi:hypothetical protein
MANKAIREFLDRCECHAKDGETDAEDIMRRSFDEEVYDWFFWDLVDHYVEMGELREAFENVVMERLFDDYRDEVECIVECYEEEE